MTGIVSESRNQRNGSSNGNGSYPAAVAATPATRSRVSRRKRWLGNPPTDPGVLIRIGEGRLALGDTDLQDTDRVADAQQQIEGTSGRIKFQFRNPLKLSDNARSAAFSLVAIAGARAVTYCADLSPSKVANVFQLYLALIPNASDLSQAASYRRGLVEAACAVSDASNRDLALRQAQARLKTLKLEMPIADMRTLADELLGANAMLTPQLLAGQYLESLASSQLPEQRRLHFCQGTFFAWNGKFWTEMEDAVCEAKLTQFLQTVQRVSVTRKLVKDVEINLKGMALLELEKRQFPRWIESLDPLVTKPSTKLVFQNGIVDEADLLQGDIDDFDWNPTLRGHDPRNFALMCLPYVFDPAAECPLWLRTLGEIFPTEGPGDHRIELLQEFMAWSLLNDPHGLEHFLVLVGDGSNGKSTILDIWTELLGLSNVSHIPLDELFNDFRAIELEGKLANIANDMNYVSKVAEGRLKQLVSREPVSANRKNKSAVTLYPMAKLIFACNELPTFTDRTDGIWRRIIVMPFLRQFSGAALDPRRKDDLKKELPGIFLWAMKGAQRLVRQGRFTECARCSAAVAEHRTNSNPIALFLSEDCVLGPQHTIRKEDLYNHFKKWCEENNHRPLCREKFGAAVLRQGVSKGRESAGIRKPTYVGVTLSAWATMPQPVPDENCSDEVEEHDTCGADSGGHSALDPGPDASGIEVGGVAGCLAAECNGNSDP